MKIAVEGCCHGELDKIYATIAHLEQKENVKVDLLLCCGDFQAVRGPEDLKTMAVPEKYMVLNTFYKYYSGEKLAPVLTVFIGGNHEASGYMQELPYGGWVAPNIYYLGYAGVVQIGGLRIGGLSGIYKGKDYLMGHFEKLPYGEDSKRSVYHIRNLEVFRLKQISRPIDIFLSHDWPCGIHEYGNREALMKKKPFFAEDMAANRLGSPPAMDLLVHLRPTYWFAAHLHVMFQALVQHPEDGMQTKFLSLDKCLPKRRFLQVLDLQQTQPGPLALTLDREWLCILKKTNHLMQLTHSRCYMPAKGGKDRFDYSVTDEEMDQLDEDFGGVYTIPDNFEPTVTPYRPLPSEGKLKLRKFSQPSIYVNPQTTLLCDMLDLVDPNAVATGNTSQSFDANLSLGNPNEISIIDDDDEDTGVLSDDNVPETSDYLSEPSFCSTPSHTPSRASYSFSSRGLSSPRGAGRPSVTSTPLAQDKLALPRPCDDGCEIHSRSHHKLPPFSLDVDFDDQSPDTVSTYSRDTSMDGNVFLKAICQVGEESKHKDSEKKSLEGPHNSTTEKPSEGSDTKIPKKKFKRRNESFYTSNEDT